MNKAININSEGEEIDLKTCSYRIYILGGFGINLGKFSISLKHKETDEVIGCKRAFWPVQTFTNGKRAKRIFIVDVKKAGTYELLFRNPDTVKVKHSNLAVFSFFNNPVSIDKLEVILSEKPRFFQF